MSDKMIKLEKELAREVKELTKEVVKLKHLEFFQVFKRPWKFMWFSFLKGLMIGFGSFLGATVVVAIFVYVVSRISLVPVLGELVQSVIEEVTIENGEPEEPASTVDPDLE